MRDTAIGGAKEAKHDAQAPPPSRGLALGVERIGLIALGRPLIAVILVLALSAAAAFGVVRIQVDDSLSQLFRSDTAEFRQFEALERRFPSSEFDVLVVIEGETLLQPASLDRLRDLVIELNFAAGVEGLISLFSAREPAEPGGFPQALIPDELPEGAEYAALIDRVMANEIIRGKLLSEDGELALIVLSLDRSQVAGAGLRASVGEIRAIVDETLAGTGLRASLSGAPVMQLEVRNALERDRLIYNSFGFIAGCLIAGLFFRRLSFMVIAAAPPLLGLLWALGTLGWLDFRLNMFLNVMTPLVMVLGFSDSMQLTYAARERLIAGESRLSAFRNTVLSVGPACVLTSMAAGLSFAALMLSESHLIRTFGAAGAIAAVITFLAVIVLQPLLGALLLRREADFAARSRRSDAAIDVLRGICGRLAGLMVRRPALYSLISLVLVGALTLLYVTLEPRYRLAEQVPDTGEAVAAGARLDAQLSGANPIHVLIEFPAGASLYEPATLDAIAAVHAMVETEAGIGNVWSPETLRRWLIERMGQADPQTIREYVEVLPEHLVRRFLAVEEDAVVVTGRIPDIDAKELLVVVDRLDQALDPVRASHAAYTLSVTGLSAIAARNSASMIRNISLALAGAMVVAAVLLGLAFRSALVSAAAVMPGLFPIVISGAVLWTLGEGLQFASVVALTVAFGLGLSATIHYLNRLRLEERAGEDPADGIRRATRIVGPALILTTLVLALGLGITMVSDMPSLRLFGWLSGFTLMAALVANILIMPATMMTLRRAGQWLQSGDRPSP